MEGGFPRYIVDRDSGNLYPIYPPFPCYLPRRRRPGMGDIATPPSVCLSVRLSVTFSFRTVTQKRIDVFSQNLAGSAPCHGGVLYSF